MGISRKSGLERIQAQKLPEGFKPWFHYESASYQRMNQYYVFGHWASLNGQTNNPHFIGLDTGCVWKGKAYGS